LGDVGTIIRTPDQRLRVFVSSTMKELAPERSAARRAIEELRLSPILFELGARPHPPRDLYRAYVEQSDIFVGVYWESYGWIAPGMSISGLHDEYELVGDKPKLIYVKTPATGRQPELDRLLESIRRDDRVSYQQFADPAELARLIKDDLALLLTERFESATEGRERLGDGDPGLTNLPVPVDSFVGRGEELDTLTRLLVEGNDRLITLTGPGGIGKTRLALQAASTALDSFEDGAHLVSLGSVTQAEVVVPVIAQSLNVQGSNAEPLLSVIGHLRHKNLLLVLDNFEQVVFAAPEIARIAEGCPRVTILVTSRAVLNLRGEREFPLEPLMLPGEGIDVEDVAEIEAVQLFVERARAINRGFMLDKSNAEAISTICRRLDGLPLALELAAARTRLLPLEEILKRLDSSLELLAGTTRDAPERHRTLRAAIDWSVGLLSTDEKRLFMRLGAFYGGCSLEAAEDVCNATRDLNVLDLMTSLLDKSLIKHELHSGEPRFTMLRTVWEYARELLDGSSEAPAIYAAHSAFFLTLVSAAHDGLRSSGQTGWLERLETDHDNLRAALEWSLEEGGAETVGEAGWTLWMFWWLNSYLAEGRSIMGKVLDQDGVSDLVRAKASAVTGILAFWQTDYAEGIPLLTDALETFRAQGEMGGVAMCQLPLAFVDSAMGEAATARQRFEESVRYFKDIGDEWSTVISMNAYCWASNAVDLHPDEYLFEEAVVRAEALGTELDLGMALRNLGGHRADQGRVQEAKELLARALKLLWRGFARGGASYTIDAIGEISAMEGAHEIAVRLFSAVDAAREENHTPIIPMFAPRLQRRIDELKAAMPVERFEAEWARGRGLGLDGASRLALAWTTDETIHLDAAESLPR